MVVAYRDPEYIRTRTLRRALALLKGCVIYEALNTSAGIFRYFETLGKLLRIRFRYDPEIYILGFRGHEIFWPVRIVTLGRKLVFDAFMSPSESLIVERRSGRAGRVAGWLIRPLERACLRWSDACLTDTELQKSFFRARFSLPADAVNVVYVGCDTVPDQAPAVPGAAGERPDRALQVLFYGTFLPLHGMDVILDACALLRERPIEFRIIGGQGRALRDFTERCASLGLGTVRHEVWVPFEELQSRYIPEADLCLGGPFGGTPQARRVITGKTFQFLAQGKPAVVGKIDEPAGFEDRVNCLLVEQADANSLAAALQWALDHREQLDAIGRRGRELYAARFSPPRLSNQLATALGIHG